MTIVFKSSKPQVGVVRYVQVLDEVVDNKDTVLYVLSQLHAEYISKHGLKFLVLEGDAKTYDTIQSIKHEYGQDLSWLIPYPGDWHSAQQHDLLSFSSIGKENFELRIKAYIFRNPSVKVQGRSR